MTPGQIKEWEQRTAAARQEFLAALPDLASTTRLLGQIHQLRAAAEEDVKRPLLEKKARISYKNGKPKKGQEVTLDMLNRELAAVDRLFLLPGVWEAHRAWEDQARRLANDPWCHVRPGMEDPHAGHSLAEALRTAWQAAPVCFVPAALTFWERIAVIARTARAEEERRQVLWGQAQRRAVEVRREMAAEIPGLFQESGPTSSAK